MTYSCSDFVDSVIGQLGLEEDIPEGLRDSPDAQAEICCAEIERLQRFAGSIILAVELFQKDNQYSAYHHPFAADVIKIAEEFVESCESPAMLDRLDGTNCEYLPAGATS